MPDPAVRLDCRHLVRRSTAAGDALHRCRLAATVGDPPACPEGCLFFEPRRVDDSGWVQAPSTPMSSTADLPPPPKPKKPRRRRT